LIVLIKVRKTVEEFRILQIIANYIFETQKIDERPYGSTTHKVTLLSWIGEGNLLPGRIFSMAWTRIFVTQVTIQRRVKTKLSNKQILR